MQMHNSSKRTCFSRRNVLGLPGHVFGKHWHQKRWPKIPLYSQDWRDEVYIRWPTPFEIEHRHFLGEGPFVMSNCKFWPLTRTDLKQVEIGSHFPILSYCRTLASTGKIPVLLEWGCGRANAVRDLTNDQEIKGRALVFGYSDVYYDAWNRIEGVKFLFFVKEHLPEYFKKMKLKIDFIFTHAGLENLTGQELADHLRMLASVMVDGALIIFPSICRRPELMKVTDIFKINVIFYEFGKDYLARTYVLTKKPQHETEDSRPKTES